MSDFALAICLLCSGTLSLIYRRLLCKPAAERALRDRVSGRGSRGGAKKYRGWAWLRSPPFCTSDLSPVLPRHVQEKNLSMLIKTLARSLAMEADEYVKQLSPLQHFPGVPFEGYFLSHHGE